VVKPRERADKDDSALQGLAGWNFRGENAYRTFTDRHRGVIPPVISLQNFASQRLEAVPGKKIKDEDIPKGRSRYRVWRKFNNFLRVPRVWGDMGVEKLGKREN